MSQQTNDLVLESLNELFQSNIHQVKSDITIIGTISKVSDNEELYYFKYQTKEYHAYNNSGIKLKKNDRVYITIPQGDFSLHKYIIGKEADGKLESAKWSDPSTQINVFQKFTFDTKQTLRLDCGIGSKTMTEPVKYGRIDGVAAPLELVNKYDRFAISADFITRLSSSVSGTYGLLIQIQGKKADKDENLQVVFTSKEMFGAIYNFSQPTNQMKVFDISNFTSIEGITISLYQMGLSSSDYNAPEVKEGQAPAPIAYEIEVPNITLSFGFAQQQSIYDTILLSSPEGENYNYQTNNATNYSDSLNKSLSVIVYKEEIDNAYLILEKYNILKETWEKVKIKTKDSEGLDEIPAQFYKNIIFNQIEMDIQEKTTTYRVRLIQKVEGIETNLITSNSYNFVNTAPISDKNSINNMETIKIFASGSDGVHYSYDENNKLISINGKQQTEFKLSIKEYTEDKEWEDITEEVQDLTFSQSDSSSNSMIKINDNKKTYTIKSTLSSSNYNNTISASFVYKGVTYNLHKNLQFGYQGTSGSDYTLVIIYDSTNKECSYKIYDMANNEVSNRRVQSTKWIIVKNNDEETTSTKETIELDTSAAIKLDLKCVIDDKTYNFSAVSGIIISDKNISGCNRVEYLSDGEIMRYFKQSYKVDGEKAGWNRGEEEHSVGSVFIPLDIEYTLKNDPSKFYEFITLTTLENTISIPVVYSYNTYSSSLVNKWDGKSIVVDEEKNFIASNRMAVGTKDNKNQFSGVLLGDYKGYADSSISGLTGIYGFDRGEQAYAFREDGTAFIGKAGTGRIWFDGNSGVIASDSWFNDGSLRSNPYGDTGLKIDLDSGYLQANGTTEWSTITGIGERALKNKAEIRLSPDVQEGGSIFEIVGSTYDEEQNLWKDESTFKFKHNKNQVLGNQWWCEINNLKMENKIIFTYNNTIKGAITANSGDDKFWIMYGAEKYDIDESTCMGALKFSTKGTALTHYVDKFTNGGGVYDTKGGEALISIVDTGITIKYGDASIITGLDSEGYYVSIMGQVFRKNS